MPLYTDKEAQDALNAGVLAAIQASSEADITIFWPRLQPALPPDGVTPWARVSYRTATQGQTSQGHCSEIGKRRYTTSMILTVEFHFPMSDDKGVARAEDLARFVRDRFRAIRLDGMILLDPRVVEALENGKSYRRNFVVECQYDTVG